MYQEKINYTSFLSEWIKKVDQDYQSGSYLFKLMKIWTFVCNIKVLIVNCENDSFTIVYEIIQFLRVENFS